MTEANCRMSTPFSYLRGALPRSNSGRPGLQDEQRYFESSSKLWAKGSETPFAGWAHTSPDLHLAHDRVMWLALYAYDPRVGLGPLVLTRFSGWDLADGCKLQTIRAPESLQTRKIPLMINHGQDLS